jgi:putative transposase
VARPYHIENQRAVEKFRRLFSENPGVIQLMLPMAEVAGLLQQGLGELVREAGLQLMMLIMEEEVRCWVGERSQPQAERALYRWGQERGYCVIDGQKVKIRRARVRGKEGRDRRLGSYALFQRSSPRVWDHLMRGLTTRNYGGVVKEFREAYGVEKSAVSEQFIEASREKLREVMERRLEKLELFAILIDGTEFKGHCLVVALGINKDGRKTVLGLREGATENATVVSELLSDLAGRRLDFTIPRLYVLEGAKALQAGVRRHAGEAAVIQRCQLHKRRNVIEHLPEEHRESVERKLKNAYGMFEYAEAKRALDRLHRELMDLNPSAARSLEEGLEETLTVHRLQVPELLRRTLASTNLIESAFSVVETVCRNVKRWRRGDQAERWVGSGLLFAESKFRRVRGYREIPALMERLSSLVPNAVARRTRVA